MKIVKGLLWILVGLVAVFFILALIGPADYHVERSKVMNADAASVWSNISDFKKWTAWSPWQEKDPTVQNEFDGEAGTVGSKMSWVGNEELTGTGSMEISAIDPMKSVLYDLKFVVPFEMQSKGGFNFSEEEGKTKITWYDEGDIPFMMRPMMLFMDLDGQMGPDFERGLNKLDSIASLKKETVVTKAEISKIQFKGQNYVTMRIDTTIAAASESEIYATYFGKLSMICKVNKVTPAGMPSTIVYEWNEEAGTCKMAFAVPVAEDVKIDTDGVEMVMISQQDAVLGKHYGSYQESGNTHGQIETYLEKNGLEYGLVIEEFANDPTTVKPEEVLTNIYYLAGK